jgi:hypothetical protein
MFFNIAYEEDIQGCFDSGVLSASALRILQNPIKSCGRCDMRRVVIGCGGDLVMSGITWLITRYPEGKIDRCVTRLMQMMVGENNKTQPVIPCCHLK